MAILYFATIIIIPVFGQKSYNLVTFLLLLYPHHRSFDVRGRSFAKALYWSDTNAFGPRAYFVTVSRPAALSVENVQLDDGGVSTTINI